MTQETALTSEELRAFDRDGYIVLRDVVSSDVLAGVNAAVDRMFAEDGPPEGEVGQWYYWVAGLQGWPEGDPSGVGTQDRHMNRRDASLSRATATTVRSELTRLLNQTRVIGLAKALVGVLSIEIGWNMSQVAMSLPGFSHRPGAGHVDGCQMNEDGNPNTFTLLVGVFCSPIKPLRTVAIFGCGRARIACTRNISVSMARRRCSSAIRCRRSTYRSPVRFVGKQVTSSSRTICSPTTAAAIMRVLILAAAPTIACGGSTIWIIGAPRFATNASSSRAFGCSYSDTQLTPKRPGPERRPLR